MTKGMKPSDPIIDYPDIKNTDVSTIKDWLGLCKTANDFYAIKWYIKYLEDEYTFYSERDNFMVIHKIEIINSYIKNFIV